MDEEFYLKLSDQLVTNNRALNLLIAEMKQNYREDVYSKYLHKLAHMMALSFDILDEIGKDYPHLNPYEDDKEH